MFMPFTCAFYARLQEPPRETLNYNTLTHAPQQRDELLCYTNIVAAHAALEQDFPTNVVAVLFGAIAQLKERSKLELGSSEQHLKLKEATWVSTHNKARALELVAELEQDKDSANKYKDQLQALKVSRVLVCVRF